jgi:hypothetical protein
MNSDEVAQFEQQAAISSNDVLNLHQALEDDRFIIP